MMDILQKYKEQVKNLLEVATGNNYNPEVSRLILAILEFNMTVGLCNSQEKMSMINAVINKYELLFEYKTEWGYVSNGVHMTTIKRILAHGTIAQFEKFAVWSNEALGCRSIIHSGIYEWFIDRYGVTADRLEWLLSNSWFSAEIEYEEMLGYCDEGIYAKGWLEEAYKVAGPVSMLLRHGWRGDYSE